MLRARDLSIVHVSQIFGLDGQIWLHSSVLLLIRALSILIGLVLGPILDPTLLTTLWIIMKDFGGHLLGVLTILKGERFAFRILSSYVDLVRGGHACGVLITTLLLARTVI